MRAFRRKIQVAIWMLCATLLTGCLVTSLMPLSDKTHPPVFDNSLLGRWLEVEKDPRNPKETVHLLFDPLPTENGPIYRITHISEIDNQATRTVYQGSLVEIDSLRILDTTSAGGSGGSRSGVEREHTIDVHIFSRVTLTDNTLILSRLNNEWFVQTALEEGVTFPCIFLCRDTSLWSCPVLLTGNPRQLREIFRKYGDRFDIFHYAREGGRIIYLRR